jgi:hypothetical protein
MDSLAVLVAASPRTDVDGVWYRHVAARRAAHALAGRQGVGRWSTRSGFPVLYLGRPTDSVVVEAYRHLIDPVEDGRILAALEPRTLVTCKVGVTDVLDLREASARMQLDLPLATLQSDTSDRRAYDRCQEVAQVAHQLGLRGIVAPAATKLGETLVLFIDVLPRAQHPARSAPDVLWERLPADPRSPPAPRLRVVVDPS